MIMDIDIPAGGDSEGSEKQHRWRKSYHLRKCTYGLKQNAARNVDVTGTADEGSERKEERVARNLRKGDLGTTVAENLAEVGFPVMWKAEFVNYDLGYLVLKVWPGPFLLLRVKCERKEIEGRPVKPREIRFGKFSAYPDFQSCEHEEIGFWDHALGRRPAVWLDGKRLRRLGL